jgi:DNA/RNA non-specific endonuclease
MKNIKKLSIMSIAIFAILLSTPKVEARMTFWDFKNKFVQTVKDFSGKAKDEYNKVKEEVKQEETTKTDIQEETEWNIVDYPDYWKSLGKSDINFNQFFVNEGEYKYSELDNLGRTGTAYAVVTLEKVEESVGWRQSWKGDVDPSGFKGNNKKAQIKLSNGKTYKGYFYNRSHLIADSLGGDPIKRNVVTGTRMQNVGNNNKKGGMQYIEMKVLNYVKRTGKNVYYKAEPVYKENELVPRYVIVNAKSEDGKINEKVLVFNTAEGYTIDYNTGKFYKN